MLRVCDALEPKSSWPAERRRANRSAGQSCKLGLQTMAFHAIVFLDWARIGFEWNHHVTSAGVRSLRAFACSLSFCFMRPWRGQRGPRIKLLAVLLINARSRGIITQKRSEERRVGKECRSRWSPY